MRVELRLEGDANFYCILVDGNWYARVQMNGEMLLDEQMRRLSVMVAALEDDLEAR